MRNTRKSRSLRRAAVTVELALVMPMFASITVGAVEAGRLFDAQNQLATAAREGARFAAMDRSDVLLTGQTSNDKVILDVKNILKAAGLPSDSIEVKLVKPDDHTTPFDLDDPDNELELFELQIKMPISAYSTAGNILGPTASLAAKVVFRNAPTVLVE